MRYLKSVGFIAAITFLLFFIACSGGGGSSSNTPSGGNNNNQPNPPNNNNGGNQSVAPVIAGTRVFPSIVLYNTPTMVMVTSSFSEAVPTRVDLLQFNVDGSSKVIGQLLDNGTNGDEAAGDGTFTLQWDVTPTSPEQIRIQVSVASGDASTPVLSEELTITIMDGPLPPDPGEAGRQTLAGIDFDGNGVRDDIQRYIAATYPDSTKQRTALTQNALALKKIILDNENETMTVDNYRQLSVAKNCLGNIFMRDNADVEGGLEAYAASRLLEARTLNTEERYMAFLNANDKIDVTTAGTLSKRISSEEEYGCAVRLATLTD